MIKQEMKDYAVRNWGFEDTSTIELFRMDERGETEETMQNFIELVEGMQEEDYFGFAL